MNNPWLINYLGKPFEYGKSGPHSYDCWGLVKAVYKEQSNIIINDIDSYPQQHYKSISTTIKKYSKSAQWKKVDLKKNLDLVLFARKNRLLSLPEHIGILLEEQNSSFILHSVQELGVLCEKIERITQRGLIIYGCYRYTL